MIYFFSHHYKNYEFIPNYAINILSEEDEQYNIFLIRKDGTIYRQDKKKKVINKMIEDGVLVEEDPQLFNLEVMIAKFLLKEER